MTPTTLDISSRGSSIHIGIDHTDPEHYAGLKALRSAENDARAMATLAAQQGFDPAVMLLGADATLEAVRDEIANAASVLDPGDTFLLTFAGHGGIVPDALRGGQGGVDRTICLYDQQLIESLLYADVARFQPGVRVVIVTDSCPFVSSAPASPDATTRPLSRLGSDTGTGDVRAVPADLALMIYRHHRITYDAWGAQARSTRRPTFMVPVLALNACGDLQEARETVVHGRFTAALLAAWSDGAYLATPQPSYRGLVARAAELIADPNQVPTLATASADDARLQYRPPFVLGG
jgi:metacaspase-1